jgi:hypothetical protein
MLNLEELPLWAAILLGVPVKEKNDLPEEPGETPASAQMTQ